MKSFQLRNKIFHSYLSLSSFFREAVNKNQKYIGINLIRKKYESISVSLTDHEESLKIGSLSDASARSLGLDERLRRFEDSRKHFLFS
jgi:hypothetical protein